MAHESESHSDESLNAAAAPAAPAAVDMTPVGEGERLLSLDAMRGVALLGILAMNITGYALPFSAYANPYWAGDPSRANYWTWLINHFVFDMKMVTIFSMLFGAGIIIFTHRAERRSGKSGSLYYSRMGWLLVIGLVHGYLLWYGDILFTYAACGMLLYPLRHVRPQGMLTLGAILVLAAIPIGALNGFGMKYMRDSAQDAMAIQEAGGELTEGQERAIAQWESQRPFFAPTPAEIESQIQTHRGSYTEIAKERAGVTVMIQTVYLIFWGVPRAGGMMLVGMGLFRLGFFTGRWSLRSYALFGAAMYAIGLPIVWWGVGRLHAHDFDAVLIMLSDGHFNYLGSVFIALGHACAVMVIARLGVFERAQRCVAAVGRMALTNYLMHTVIATTLFYGYGFGLYGAFDRVQLMGVVFAIWALQLALSPWWLKRFKFGPMEWVWRSLTYRSLQPFVRARTAGDA